MNKIVNKFIDETNERNFNSHAFDPLISKKQLNKFRGETLNFDYKSVLLFFRLLENNKIIEACEVIGITIEMIQKHDKNIKDESQMFIVEVYKYLNGQRFVFEGDDNYIYGLKVMLERGKITQKEYDKEVEEYSKAQEKEFCHFADYDLVYNLMIMYFGIDLYEDYINWFDYLFKLNVLLEEETNALIERIKKRTFKPLKGKNVGLQNLQGKRLKQKYKI